MGGGTILRKKIKKRKQSSKDSSDVSSNTPEITLSKSTSDSPLSKFSTTTKTSKDHKLKTSSDTLTKCKSTDIEIYESPDDTEEDNFVEELIKSIDEHISDSEINNSTELDINNFVLDPVKINNFVLDPDTKLRIETDIKSIIGNDLVKTIDDENIGSNYNSPELSRFHSRSSSEFHSFSYDKSTDVKIIEKTHIKHEKSLSRCHSDVSRTYSDLEPVKITKSTSSSSIPEIKCTLTVTDEELHTEKDTSSSLSPYIPELNLSIVTDEDEDESIKQDIHKDINKKSDIIQESDINSEDYSLSDFSYSDSNPEIIKLIKLKKSTSSPFLAEESSFKKYIKPVSDDTDTSESKSLISETETSSIISDSSSSKKIVKYSKKKSDKDSKSSSKSKDKSKRKAPSKSDSPESQNKKSRSKESPELKIKKSSSKSDISDSKLLHNNSKLLEKEIISTEHKKRIDDVDKIISDKDIKLKVNLSQVKIQDSKIKHQDLSIDQIPTITKDSEIVSQGLKSPLSPVLGRKSLKSKDALLVRSKSKLSTDLINRHRKKEKISKSSMDDQDMFTLKVNFIIDLLIENTGENVLNENQQYTVDINKIKLIHKKDKIIIWNIFHYYFITYNSGRIVLYEDINLNNNKFRVLRMNPELHDLYIIFTKYNFYEINLEHITNVF